MCSALPSVPVMNCGLSALLSRSLKWIISFAETNKQQTQQHTKKGCFCPVDHLLEEQEGCTCTTRKKWAWKWLWTQDTLAPACLASHPSRNPTIVGANLWVVWSLSSVMLYWWVYLCRSPCTPKTTLQTCLSFCFLTISPYVLKGGLWAASADEPRLGFTLRGWTHKVSLRWASLCETPCLSVGGGGPAQGSIAQWSRGGTRTAGLIAVWSVVFFSFPENEAQMWQSDLPVQRSIALYFFHLQSLVSLGLLY